MSSLAIHDEPGASCEHWPSQWSFEVTQGQQKFLLSFWLRRDTEMRLGSLCLTHQGVSNDVQYDLFGSSWVITWLWPEVNFWSWFKVMLYMFRRSLTRETRWCKRSFLTFLYQKLFSKNHFRKIPSFWIWWPLESKALTSPQIWRKTSPGLFQGYLIFFSDLFSLLWFSRYIWQNTLILRKFEIRWTLVTSILTWKNMNQIVSKELWTSYRTFLFDFSYDVFWKPSYCGKVSEAPPPAVRFRVS